MKNVFPIFIILLVLFNFSSCSRNGLASSDNASPQSAPAKTNSESASPAAAARGESASSPESKNQETKDSPKSSAISNNSFSDAELQEQITNNIGNLIVATFYQPHFIEGDFNGDKLMDAAIVVGAEDRYASPGEIGDLFTGLKFLVEGVSFQNLRTGGNLIAKPKQRGIDIEKNKTKLKAESRLGLLIILSGAGDWKSELSKTNYDRKFLLLDALFGSEFENKEDNTKWLSIVKKGENCLPSAARGEGIFSGDAESAGKVIYFTGKDFAWTQCGE